MESIEDSSVLLLFNAFLIDPGKAKQNGDEEVEMYSNGSPRGTFSRSSLWGFYLEARKQTEPPRGDKSNRTFSTLLKAAVATAAASVAHLLSFVQSISPTLNCLRLSSFRVPFAFIFHDADGLVQDQFARRPLRCLVLASSVIELKNLHFILDGLLGVDRGSLQHRRIGAF